MIAELIGANVSASKDKFGLVELNGSPEAVQIASETIQEKLGLVEMTASSNTIVLGDAETVLMMRCGV